ncbi:MAG: BatA domain-containing protein [Candidatus Krumholzibacteria bacterium]|nr:BatA domain-containing protein [Candidatus Krumholzibacteria bacterium]
MNFINPAFLFALTASAVPLLIHLLSRRRAREVPFSSLRFLERSDRKSMRRINLRRLILLALRTAAIALIALAFARPVITGRTASLFPGKEPKSVVVMIDRSYSMGVRGNEGTAFDAAAAAALDIAGGLDENDELTLVLFDEGTEEIFTAERPGRAAAAGALAGAGPSLKGTDLRAAAGHGSALLEKSRRTAREMFIISDFQRTGLAVAGNSAAFEGTRVFLVPVIPASGPNIAVERVILPGSAVHRGEAAAMRVFVRNTSSDRPAGSPLRVELDGRRIMEKEIELEPGSGEQHTFEFDAGRSGWIRGSVSCREDMLPADDARLFTLLVREKTPVLLIAGGGGFYLGQALVPEGADGDIDLAARGWSGYTTADLAGADVVVAGPGGRPRTGDPALLRRYAEGGGRVVVFISPGMERFAGRLSSHDLTIEARETGEGFIELERPEAGLPLLSIFSEVDLDGMAGLRFAMAAAVEGLPAGSADLSFSDGTPFVWVEGAGEGEIIFAAFSPVPESGDLVLSPWFLPLVQQMVLAPLSVSPGREGGLIGSTVQVPLAGEGDCVIVLPCGEEYVDPARTGLGRITVPAGDRQGYLTAGCGSGEWQTAINPDCRLESSLDYMTADEAADSLGLTSWAAAGADAGISEAVREAREGREIADVLIIAAALLLVAELAVAQRPGGGGETA